MTLVVETGTGLPNAESYVSAADCAAYAAARSLSFDAGASDAEPALRRATIYIDATYRLRFPGYPTNRRAQALQWPRQDAYVKTNWNGKSPLFYPGGVYGYPDSVLGEYDYLQPNSIPVEIINATCEGAVRELAKPGALAPDLKRGGAIKMIRAGTVEVQYGSSATPNTIFQVIDDALVSLLIPSNAYSGRVTRG